MPFTARQIVDDVRGRGLPKFTARQLERWANLGVIPHPQRRGLGRGRGYTFLWPDDARLIALFLADAQTWQKPRRFEDTVLWAWLRGAPVSTIVVGRFLERAFRRMRRQLEKRLDRKRRVSNDAGSDELLDLVDRLAVDLAYRHKGAREAGLTVTERQAVMQELFASLAGARGTGRSSRQTSAIYKRAWDALMKRLGIPWDTGSKEVRLQGQFFSYRNLEALVRDTSDEELLVPRNQFAQDFLFAGTVLEEHASGRDVPKSALARARRLKKVLDVLFQMDPSWVWALYAYPVLRDRDATKTEA